MLLTLLEINLLIHRLLIVIQLILIMMVLLALTALLHLLSLMYLVKDVLSAIQINFITALQDLANLDQSYTYLKMTIIF